MLLLYYKVFFFSETSVCDLRKQSSLKTNHIILGRKNPRRFCRKTPVIVHWTQFLSRLLKYKKKTLEWD